MGVIVSESTKNQMALRLFRKAAQTALDALAAALGLLVATSLRMGGQIPQPMLDALPGAMLLTAAVTAAAMLGLRAHRRAWRYVSVADLRFLVVAVTASVAVSYLALRMSGRGDWLPASVPIIQWFVVLALMAGMRLARRISREQNLVWPAFNTRPAQQPVGRERSDIQRILLVGPSDRIDAALRSIETAQRAEFKPVGIIDYSGRETSLWLRGVPVLGTIESLENVVNTLDATGERPDCLFLVGGVEHLHGTNVVQLVNKAESLGLMVGRMTGVLGVEAAKPSVLNTGYADMAALLGRPQTRRDRSVAREAIAGARVLVTGAGGTIGSELVRQIAAMGPALLVLLDHCEFNLYTIDMEMQENFPDLPRHSVLCSIRQRECLMQAFAAHRPDLVFHAAALKHVPLVENNPCAGVLTNVIGTRNVADAALAYQVRAMVQVSTDKAVNPVGIMGATKRLGELYCQALDLAGQRRANAPRFMTVRFGNVLGSSGSLIPLLQRQLARRGPLTITHPDIERYFMTVHEAVQLILQSSAQAVAENNRRGRIFVLDMGAPIKVIDIARRMIRLAGLEPDVDIKIDIVGLRPGEKLYEELFDSSEPRLPSTLEGIFEAEPEAVPIEQLDRMFNTLEAASLRDDVETVRKLVRAAIERKPVRLEPQPLPPKRQPVRAGAQIVRAALSPASEVAHS
jgi:O-antigen biosynthesis protein WbqV